MRINYRHRAFICMVGVARLKIISRGRSRLSFSASHWTFEGRFCCIGDLPTLKVSPLSYYGGKEAVVLFPSRSWQL